MVSSHPETQHEVEYREAEGPQTLEDLLMPTEPLPLQQNYVNNEEQEMVVDIVEETQPQAEIPEPEPVPLNINDEQQNFHNIEDQEMVVDIVEEPQILDDLQQEIPIVDNNEADIKIFGQQILTVFMKKEDYFGLSVPQRRDISKKMEKTVNYGSKDLMRRQKFKADPEQILKYLEHVEEKNLAVTFNFNCLFDRPVENEVHERELFQDMLSDENIERTAQFPSEKYFFKNINISQFKTFLTIFN